MSEALTTNYDTLLEAAWKSAGRKPTVLPESQRATTSEWLVKLHGSVDSSKPLVISRRYYLRFEGENAALAGIVQAMLLTRHLLFVGYSLSDENFHRIIHEVEQGTPSHRTRNATFGTS